MLERALETGSAAREGGAKTGLMMPTGSTPEAYSPRRLSIRPMTFIESEPLMTRHDRHERTRL